MKFDEQELKNVLQQSGCGAHETRIETCIVSDADALLALKDEWDALWRQVGGRHNQSFDVCWLAWTHVAKARGQQLRCIVCRENGQLVLVWPLVSHRRFIWSVLEPLSPGTAELTGMLACPEAHAAIDAAWAAATRQCGGDIFKLPYVAKLSRLNAHASLVRDRFLTTPDVCATVLLRDQPDWSAYTGALGTLYRRKPGALERRFEKEGVLEVRTVDSRDTQAHAQWVDWVLAQKRGWSKRVAKHGEWLESDAYRAFLVDLLDGTKQTPWAVVLMMTMNGEPVAANILGVGPDATCVSGLITAFDPAFSKFTPGAILMERTVRWSLENGLDLDLGVGKEDFKAYWSRNNISEHESHVLAVSRFGRLALSMKRIARRLVRLASIRPRFAFTSRFGS